MKKTVISILMIVLVISIAACGKKAANSANQQVQTPKENANNQVPTTQNSQAANDLENALGNVSSADEDLNMDSEDSDAALTEIQNI